MGAHPSWLLPFLIGVGFVAGWLGAITGAGGLIALPALLAVGVPPHLALGTNMLQSSTGTVAAAVAFMCLGHVNLTGVVRSGIVSTIVGAIIGVVAIHQLPPEAVRGLVPALLLGVVILLSLIPRAGMRDVSQRLSSTLVYVAGGLSLGFVDGFIGAGAGALWAAAFVMGLGYNFSKATGYAKVMNATSNTIAFTIYLAYGSVWLSGGLAMALGQLFGGIFGAKQVAKRGPSFVRPIYFAAVVALLLKLLLNRR